MLLISQLVGYGGIMCGVVIMSNTFIVMLQFIKGHVKTPKLVSYHKVSTMRNKPCSCGSGIKFKKCLCGNQRKAEFIRSNSL